MEKVVDFDISSKGEIMEIEDINKRIYVIKNKKKFIKHIFEFHSFGNSIHEENGYFFLINDEFRRKLKKIEKEK